MAKTWEKVLDHAHKRLADAEAWREMFADEEVEILRETVRYLEAIDSLRAEVERLRQYKLAIEHIRTIVDADHEMVLSAKSENPLAKQVDPR